jgi:hypothetical protein
MEVLGASVRYLPAYSPGLNLIEQAFRRERRAFRRVARVAGPDGRVEHVPGDLDPVLEATL